MKDEVAFTIYMDRAAREQLREEARSYGLGSGRFLVAVFLDYLWDRRPLRLSRFLPGVPKGKQKPQE